MNATGPVDLPDLPEGFAYAQVGDRLVPIKIPQGVGPVPDDTKFKADLTYKIVTAALLGIAIFLMQSSWSELRAHNQAQDKSIELALTNQSDIRTTMGVLGIRVDHVERDLYGPDFVDRRRRAQGEAATAEEGDGR